MKVRDKIMKKILYVVFTILCIITLAVYFHFASKLNIDKIDLKNKSIFKITNEYYEFKLSKLRNKSYNVVLNFSSSNASDLITLRKIMFIPGEFNIMSQILDEKGNIIKSSLISGGRNLSGGWSKQEVQWDILNFVANAEGSYKLRINFKSKVAFFDKLNKEIYLIQDYDNASMPWWYLFKWFALIVFVLSFIGLIATYLITRFFAKPPT